MLRQGRFTFFKSVNICVLRILYSYAVWGVFALLGVWDGLDLEGQLLIWSLPTGVNFLMGLWDFAANYAAGMQSTKVFGILRLPNTYWIYLSPYSLLNLDNDPYGEWVIDMQYPPVNKIRDIVEIICPATQHGLKVRT